MNVLRKKFLSSIQYLIITILMIGVGMSYLFIHQGAVETKTEVKAQSSSQHGQGKQQHKQIAKNRYNQKKKSTHIVHKTTKRATAQGVHKTTKRATAQGVHKTTKRTTAQGVHKTTKRATAQGVHKTTKRTTAQGVYKATKRTTAQGVYKATKRTTAQGAHKTTKRTTVQGVQKATKRTTVQQISKRSQQISYKEPIKRKIKYPIVKGESIEALSMLSQYPKYNVMATGYSPGPESTGKNRSHPAFGITYSGVKARRDTFSTIAADIRVFPLGSVLYIPGYGYGIVSDTGSAIKGNKIDLYFDTKEDVYKEWGKKKVDVYLIEKGNGKVDEQMMRELNNLRGSVARK